MTPICADDLTHDQLVQALRNSAAGCSTTEAAIELLIEHNRSSGHWLRREPFRRNIHIEQDGPKLYGDVHWNRIKKIADLRIGLPDTDSEVGVLRVAASLAVGDLGHAMNSCDPRNRELISNAVAHAGGNR